LRETSGNEAEGEISSWPEEKKNSEKLIGQADPNRRFSNKGGFGTKQPKRKNGRAQGLSGAEGWVGPALYDVAGGVRGDYRKRGARDETGMGPVAKKYKKKWKNRELRGVQNKKDSNMKGIGGKGGREKNLEESPQIEGGGDIKKDWGRGGAKTSLGARLEVESRKQQQGGKH